MVCIPCIVVPFLLWFFHKYIRPIVMKFWDPWSKQGKISEKLPPDKSDGETQGKTQLGTDEHVNGVANGVASEPVAAGGDKKTD